MSNRPANWNSSARSPAASAAARRFPARESRRRPKTHPYISTGLKTAKFGVAFDEAFELYRRAATLPHIAVKGIDCHIGSQLLDPAPAAEAADKVLALVDRLAAAGIALEHIDLGGGMGIQYRDRRTGPGSADYLAPMLAARRPPRETDLRTGPLAGRQCRPAADPRRSAEARRGKALRRGRRGDERPDAAGAL
jgi:diaminopimelate decarboxylase